jgi:hypothetical protein
MFIVVKIIIEIAFIILISITNIIFMIVEIILLNNYFHLLKS